MSLNQSASNYLSPQVLNLCSFVCLLPFPTYLTPHVPLVTVILFFIAKSLVLFCSFVWWIRFLTLNVKLLSYQVLIKFPRKLSSHLTDLHLNFFVLMGTFARGNGVKITLQSKQRDYSVRTLHVSPQEWLHFMLKHFWRYFLLFASLLKRKDWISGGLQPGQVILLFYLPQQQWCDFNFKGGI